MTPNTEQTTNLLVRYEELVPCTTAFVDARTPGSREKENFTIIGPGVAENPDQYVHIKQPHGFNIGGARQPPNCVNSQHSHETEEVFVVHSGRWAFTTGELAQDGRVELGPGDTISIPTRCFRGFENIGEETGFLFAVLGGDDPGRVTWAPYVFEQAQAHGLVLLDNGQLIDTAAGETVPAGAVRMPITSRQDVASLSQLDSQALEACVVRRQGLALRASALGSDNVFETPLIGSLDEYSLDEDSQASQQAGPLAWPHTFQLRHLLLEAGATTTVYARPQPEVLLMHRGDLEISVGETRFQLSAGDVFTSPINQARFMRNIGTQDCEIFVVHGSAHPSIRIETT